MPRARVFSNTVLAYSSICECRRSVSHCCSNPYWRHSSFLQPNTWNVTWKVTWIGDRGIFCIVTTSVVISRVLTTQNAKEKEKGLLLAQQGFVFGEMFTFRILSPICNPEGLTFQVEVIYWNRNSTNYALENLQLRLWLHFCHIKYVKCVSQMKTRAFCVVNAVYIGK